jgi:hypothetical protein
MRRVFFQQNAGNATDHGEFNLERKGECSAASARRVMRNRVDRR